MAMAFGKLVAVYAGREYQGNVPIIAQVLSGGGNERATLQEITLESKSVRPVTDSLDKPILLEYNEISGTGANNRPYTLRVDGKLATPALLDQITNAAMGLVK
jgi:hypothetical protein